MKKIFKFLGFLLPWFISGIVFKSDTVFYNSLNLPTFAPKPIIFGVVWPILYILIAISIYKVFDKSDPEYKKTLLINYFLNQIFSFLFFTLKSPFLGLIATVATLVSSLFVYYETKEIDKQASKFLIPYILWNIFASILITSIFFMNI